MEFDRFVFDGNLLDILTAISESHFVALDLELSGVSSKQGARTKKTLEDRYQEVRDAASRYTILQFGLTCVIEDRDAKRYILKPFNFYLNPIIEEKIGLDRIYSYQGSAVEFLLYHGFRMELPYTAGIPYLSREEAEKAKQHAVQRLDRSKIEDIILKDDEVDAKEFMKLLREVITSWRGKKKASNAFLDISSNPPTLSSREQDEDRDSRPLSRFEKRLVHQLVRAEFPDCVSLGRQNCVRIIPFDAERESSILKGKIDKIDFQIKAHTGFRWIFEALVGGDLDLDVMNLAKDPETGKDISINLEDVVGRFSRVKESLKHKRPVVVGHNVFTDLVNLYSTFVGELPPTVAEFRSQTHELFPFVIDTKYMATHGDKNSASASSLEDMAESLSSQKHPVTEMDPKHQYYVDNEVLHEAGYDSYLTALVALRLSTKLEDSGEYIDDPILFNSSARRSVSSFLAAAKETVASLAGLSFGQKEIKTDALLGGTSVSRRDKATNSVKEDVAEENGAKENGIIDTDDQERAENPSEFMPPFESNFWRVYGNKLRIFGSVEGMLDLSNS